MILADTSIWIEHLRSTNRELAGYLNQGQIAIHPFIVAELALGTLRRRAATLALLDALPQLPVAHLNEVRLLIETRHLYGLGIGLTDAHLIASVMINPPTLLWTTDKRLRQVATEIGVHLDRG